MPYRQDNNNGQNYDVNELKKMVSEKLNGIDVDNIAPDQIKGLLINEINKNSSIDPGVKEKIKSGDVEGLKEEIIKYLSNNKTADGSSDQLINILKNNDMEGLKKQLVGMLLSGIGSQKKNEVKENQEGTEAHKEGNDGEETRMSTNGGFEGFDEKVLMGLLFDKMFAGVKDDKRIMLLNSVKPFVSEKRQKGIDDCIRIMNIVAFFENFMSKAGK